MIKIDNEQDRQLYAAAYERWLKRNESIKSSSTEEDKQWQEFIERNIKLCKLRQKAEAIRFNHFGSFIYDYGECVAARIQKKIDALNNITSGTQPAIIDAPMKTKKTRKAVAVYTIEELQIARDQALHDGFLKGKAEGIREAQAKYNYQNTMLEAVKQQAAAMEYLTKLIQAVNKVG